jgi:cytochrome c peroxidase/DNA-binding beta-propeller fold protein YncE
VGSAAGSDHTHVPPTVREGGALARGVGEAALYVADEDHRTLRRVPLPVKQDSKGTTLELPGAPAQVLPLDGRVLVTIRDPGMLVVVAPDAQGVLTEKSRTPLPDDAWGIAITPDEKIALVSSAWTHQVSAVDLATSKKLWSLDVGREPRAIAIKADGSAAYVTHLVGSVVTRIDRLGGDPERKPIVLPPSPLRSPSGVTLPASLGYAAVLSPDGSRLFAARHALGALGEDAWFGASTVDVLLTASDTPLAAPRRDGQPFLRADKATDGADLAVPGKPLSPFTQPRAMVYRKRTSTLLVASEGEDVVVELDALGVDPTLGVLRRHDVGSDRDATLPVSATCAAPSGLALSEDEATAWVWCRATYDLATIALDAKAETPSVVRLAEDGLDADGAIGRRIFYDATDRVTSGGLACAGCHPEGRDDGHVWHEAKLNTKDGTHVNFVGHEANIPAEERVKGAARRTPMLAGRVAANGPYGWHAESADLPTRLHAGFGLHRWGGMPAHQGGNLAARSGRLALFLRKGLVPPPGIGRELDETEQRGRELFKSTEVGCTGCHKPETEYTDRVAYPMPRVPIRPGFDDEAEKEFKTPSLKFVGGRAPYFHDGRAPTLEWVIDNNDDRMGHTNQLSGPDRKALVAFLKTL